LQDILRHINGTKLILAAMVATLGALLFPIWSYADRSGTGQANLAAGAVPTQWGPLSTADRDFLVKVRLAGLWELPAGQQAMERAPTQAIRDAGDHLIVGHRDLDKRCRDIAAQLGVELPNEPTEQQKGFLRELSAAEGLDYQRKFANILRVSHGKVFSLIADIRHSTRNVLIRQLADAANVTVLDHITMLERTGLVDFDSIAIEQAETNTASPSGPPPPTSTVIPAPIPVIPGDGVTTTSKPSAEPTGEPASGTTADSTAVPEPVG
jgi:putative membrane protein